MSVRFKPFWQFFAITLPLLLNLASMHHAHANSAMLDFQQHPITAFIPHAAQCKSAPTHLKKYPQSMQIVHIDLDYIYDDDPKQLRQNLKHLIQRLQIIQPNSVFLQAFADPDGNGSADQVYFKNRHVPMRSDLLNRVIIEIRKNTDIEYIFAWLPLLAWEFKHTGAHADLQYVQHAQLNTNGYIRLSPFTTKNIQLISEIFTDFAQHVVVDGILFHDDITLNDFEDSSPPAIRTYQHWGFSADYVLHPTQTKQLQFAHYKTEYLDQLAYGIKKIVQCYQPNILSARNSYAPILLRPESEKWFAQSLSSTFKYYDFNAIMAMPYMENSPDHAYFYRELVKASRHFDPTLQRSIFELQAKNWQDNQPIPTQKIIQDMQLLQKLEVKHLGYYPDDFLQNHPNPQMIKDFFKSLKD